MPRFRKSSISRDEFHQGQHRFEHWYRDNQVYFITARCRGRFPAFETEAAKLVNDLLRERLTPFWYDTGKQGYFGGCIRDVLQATRAYRYTLLQAVRHRIVTDYRGYPHTRVNVEMDVAIRRAVELRAFMEGVPYARYERHLRRGR